MEKQILNAAIQSREAYENIKKLGSHEDVSELGSIILTEVGIYYEADPKATVVDREILLNRISRKYEKHSDTFTKIIEETTENISITNLLNELLDLRRRTVSFNLASALTSEDYKKVDTLIQRYISIEEEFKLDDEPMDFHQVTVKELFAEDEKHKRYILYPKTVNDKLDGGVIKGDNILVFARPEVGKSLVIINAACGFLSQGLKVQVFGNEDAPRRMLPRYISRLTNKTKIEIMQDVDLAHEEAMKAGYGNLSFHHMNPGTFREFYQKTDEFEPDVVIIDQLRHVNVYKESKVEQLEVAANHARRLASKQNVVMVSTTQAGDSADRKLILGQGDVDYSNTGIPGAMDLMLGVGMNDEFERRNMRRITPCKNKMGGDHAYVDVMVDPSKSKVVSI